MVDLESNIQMWRPLGTKPRSLTGAVHTLRLRIAGPECWSVVRKCLTLFQAVKELYSLKIYSFLKASIRRIKYLKQWTCMGNI